MNGKYEFRALLLKIQDLLSESDRTRFLSLLGEDIPRKLREDPSLFGAVRLLESHLDRAIITDQDCTYLINAFTQIQCHDAAEQLRGLLASNFENVVPNRQLNVYLLVYHQTQGQNQTLKLSLQSILLNDTDEEDKIFSTGMYPSDFARLLQIESLFDD